jgi:hypothetical protein
MPASRRTTAASSTPGADHPRAALLEQRTEQVGEQERGEMVVLDRALVPILGDAALVHEPARVVREHIDAAIAIREGCREPPHIVEPVVVREECRAAHGLGHGFRALGVAADDSDIPARRR